MPKIYGTVKNIFCFYFVKGAFPKKKVPFAIFYEKKFIFVFRYTV